MKGSEKNEKKRGGSSHLVSARSKQGMEGRASCCRQFFSIQKGRFPAFWNEISTKMEGEQLRQRGETFDGGEANKRKKVGRGRTHLL